MPAPQKSIDLHSNLWTSHKTTIDAVDCPTRDTIEEFAEGTLADHDFERIAVHLDGCSPCEGILSELETAGLLAIAEPTRGTDDKVMTFTWELHCKAFVDALRNQPLQSNLSRIHEDAQSTQQRPRFRRIRSHASGGLGQVSVALDSEVSRQVALKEILPQCAGNPEVRRRFLREAQITGQLEHPGIVPIHSIDHHPDGRPFCAMRFVDGSSLTDEIRSYHAAETDSNSVDSRLKLRTLLNRFIDVCDAVNYAHKRGIVHRDIKPDNILLGENVEALLVDWGLAKRLEDDQPTTEGVDLDQTEPIPDATAMGAMVGMVAYMSPDRLS